MAGIKTLFINLAILGLLIFGIMSFIIITQGDNSASDSVGEHELMNNTYGSLYGKLTGAEGSSQSASDTFGEASPPSQNLGEMGVTSIISTTRLLKAMSQGLWNIYIKLPMAILGVSPAVASVMSSIVMFSLIIGAWAIWKGVFN